jgi:hypothetical protein
MDNAGAPRYLMCPHTVLAEREARHLALLIPQLGLLQVIQPVIAAAVEEHHLTAVPVVRDAAFLERVQLLLRGYKDFASIHENSGSLAVLREDFGADHAEASRFRLQSELRGKPSQSPDMNAWLRLEAAVFLELAREFDIKELELESQYERMQELEEGFRQILGVIDGEEAEEVVETANPPLVSDRSRLSFMLTKRLVCWYRLLATLPRQSLLIPVALTRDVPAELVDPIQSQWEREGRKWSMAQRPLVTLPNLRQLTAEQEHALHQELQRQKTLPHYWDALKDVVLSPDEEQGQERLETAVRNLREGIFQFCLQQNLHPRGQVTLTLTWIEAVTGLDLWRGLDKTGFEHLADESGPAPEAARLLCLECIRTSTAIPVFAGIQSFFGFRPAPIALHNRIVPLELCGLASRRHQGARPLRWRRHHVKSLNGRLCTYAASKFLINWPI